MSLELVLEVTPFGARAALLGHGALIEVRFADNEINDIRGQVFLARVRSVDRNLDAAFIDCGHGKMAYLSGRDARYLSGERRDEALSRRVSEGQAVLVQGAGVSRDGKKPKVTSDIQLTGMYLIYRPRRRSIKMSSRLAKSGQADRLRKLAADLFPKGGVILRAAASEASEEDLLAESERLAALWKEIEAKVDGASAPACLFRRQDPLHRVLHDAIQPGLARIVVGDRLTLARARTFLEGWLPAMVDQLECIPGAFEINGINDQLEDLLLPRVELDGGGSLIIESTAAFTAIDVNGGGRRALDANLDAARAIARQLRLRRIGGTVVVDFIDLSSKGDRDRLMQTLKSAFADDPAAVQILPPTALGLVQISRQRLGPSLAERLHRPCPTCAGGGRVVNLRGAAERMLGELAERSPGAAGVPVRVAVDLYSYIRTDVAEPWRQFVERHGISPPNLRPDETLAPGSYRIAGADIV